MRRADVTGFLAPRRDEIAHRFGIRSPSLSGSVARDEARPDSDADVLAEFDGPATFGFVLETWRTTIRFDPIPGPQRGMETGLNAYGAGVRARWVLPFTNTFDMAPTIATTLGLDLPDAEGKPIVGVFTGKGSSMSEQ